MGSRAEALAIDFTDAGGARLGVSISQVRPATRDFRLFFQDEYARLARALYVLTTNRAEAEELTQEAMVRVYEHWDRVGMMDSPAGYLYRTALNLHRSKLRRLATRARRPIRHTTGPDHLAEIEDRDELGRLLETLPLSQRQALVLVELLGMSAEEAGRILRIEPVSVRVRLSRARTLLRQRATDGE